MICKNCGKELPNGSSFCPICGANLIEEAALQAETPEAVEQVPAAEPSVSESPEDVEPATAAEPSVPETSGTSELPEEIQPLSPAPARKKKKGLVIAIAAVLIAAVAVCLTAGVFANPTVTLAKAAVKTMEEFKALAEKSKFKAVGEVITSDDISARASLGIRSLYDKETYAGLGLTLSFSSDIEDEKANLAVTPFYGAADIATAGVAAYDHRIFIGSPELLDGKYAGVDTLTVGQDLKNQLDIDGFTTVSFNLFDLAKELKKNLTTPEMVREKLDAPIKALLGAVTVEKTGKESRTINDIETEVTAFTAAVPAAETKALLEAYKQVLVDAADASDPYDLLAKMGIPTWLIDAVLGKYQGMTAESLTALFDNLEEFVDSNDGLKLSCYVANGYVRALETTGIVDGDPYTLSLELGTQSMITQTIRVTVIIGGGENDTVVTIESTGDHIAATTMYLDTTTITLQNGGEPMEVACFNTEYDTKNGDFVFKADALSEEFKLTLTGNLTGTEDSLAISGGILTLAEYDESICELSLDLALNNDYQDFISVNTDDYYNFATMSLTDWYVVAGKLYSDGLALASGLDSELLDLLSYFF